jgi:hypothetical protein
MKKFGLTPLELLVIESDVARRSWIHVIREDRISSQFAKSVKVQLPGKAREVRMLEVEGQNELQHYQGE